MYVDENRISHNQSNLEYSSQISILSKQQFLLLSIEADVEVPKTAVSQMTP